MAGLSGPREALTTRGESGYHFRRITTPDWAVQHLLPRAIVWCRIQLRQDNSRLVVHLAGHLSEAQVPELLAACADAQAPLIELDELISADAVGLDALVRVEQRGAQLVGLLEYLRFELDALIRKRV